MANVMNLPEVVLQILQLGAIGLCFLLMYLAYTLLRDNRSAPQTGYLAMVKFYIMASVFLVILFAAAQVYSKSINVVLAVELT